MSTAEFDDPAFLARLRAGEDGAYRQLIRRFHASLVSVANSIIGSRAQSEEVVQDAWLAVFNGIGRFHVTRVTWHTFAALTARKLRRRHRGYTAVTKLLLVPPSAANWVLASR